MLLPTMCHQATTHHRLVCRTYTINAYCQLWQSYNMFFQKTGAISLAFQDWYAACIHSVFFCVLMNGYDTNQIQLQCGVCVLLFWSRHCAEIDKKLIRRWDSERELSLRRHCTRTKNTIDPCINSATDRFLQRRFNNFTEITQCNGHYAVQGHSGSPILVPIESSYTTSY